jgi:hypothetical protein
MSLNEGLVPSLLPVVDELLGLNWTDDTKTMKRSNQQLEDWMQVRWDDVNPWIYADLRCEDQIPWVVTQGRGGQRITWRFEDTGVDILVVQTIWNTLTGDYRFLLPRPNRHVSQYLLYVSGDREHITIQHHMNPEWKMCFKRVHPEGGVRK